MKSIRISFLAVLMLLFLLSNSYSQEILFSSSRWEISANEGVVETYNGRESLKLKGGIAFIKDLEAGDCILEYDFLTTGVRGFMGAIWNLQDRSNYEEFYVRPHQLGKPDASQYTPVFNGVAGWQLYHGKGYSAALSYPFNEWVHVKIIISGKSGEVYISDMEKPALYIPEMKRSELKGKVGVEANNASYAWFSNFSVTEIKSPALKGKAPKMKASPKGIITSWMVSDPISFNTVRKKTSLAAEDLAELKWEILDSESTGITNLARISKFSRAANTVLAKVKITSDRAQVKKVTFGFSDIGMVFLNNDLIYSGSKVYASRDYRYLGTMGLFDEVVLNLKEGENELIIAVAESFGGWGLIGQIENQDGITVSGK